MYSPQNTAPALLPLNSLLDLPAANDDKHFYQQLTVAGPDSAQLALLRILRQHQHQKGWIVLVAPTQLPDKFLAECYQLSLNNILVVHQKQISDLTGTLAAAFRAKGCTVVINFSRQLDPHQLINCQQLAVAQKTWFYQLQGPDTKWVTH